MDVSYGKGSDPARALTGALETTHTNSLSDQVKPDAPYELHAFPPQLSERTRKPGSTAVLDEHDDVIPDSLSIQDNAAIRDSPGISSNRDRRLTDEQKRKSLVQFIALCWCIWTVGWNDSTTGPLLPRLQDQYQVDFAVVSLIFVGNSIGNVGGAALNVWLNDRVGFGKVIVLGTACQLAGYCIMASAPPFPVLVCAYAIVGTGLSILNAQTNGFVGSLHENMSTKLGILHGVYGLGAFTAPWASTYFSKFSDRRWAFHFILSASFAFIDMVILITIFKFRRQEDVLLEAGQEPNEETLAGQEAGGNRYRQMFALKAVPLLIAFALIYEGVEVTLGGWIVTYIIRRRDGGSNSGFISSGFFGGLMLGRICLMWLNKLVGEHRVVIFYALVAIALELTVWFVPSVVENALAVSLIGIVLGPMFPLMVSKMSHILPRWLLTGCVGLVTGIGIAGSAVIPLVTGLLASKYGIESSQPLMISMMGAMLLVWTVVPKSARRIE